jgi:hypothetical protein
MYVLYNVHINSTSTNNSAYIETSYTYVLYLRKYIIAFYIVRVVLFVKQWYDELLILTFSALSKQ